MGRSWIVAWIVAWVGAWLPASTTVALADAPPRPAPVKRKPASDAYPPEALAFFVEGVIADKAGDLGAADGGYRRSLRASPQANTYYNLANLQHRREWFPQAIVSYRKYLELAPDASDRADVERLIEAIEKRPSIAVIDGREPGAIVIVDGEVVGPSPALIYPSQGRHVVDHIGPTSYVHTSFFVGAAPRTDHVDARYVERAGNVVLSPSPRLVWRGTIQYQGQKLAFPGRFTLPPGRHELRLPPDEYECNAIVIQVAKGDHITHVYLEVLDEPRTGGCRPLSAHTQKVKLPS